MLSSLTLERVPLNLPYLVCFLYNWSLIWFDLCKTTESLQNILNLPFLLNSSSTNLPFQVAQGAGSLRLLRDGLLTQL